MHDAGPRDGGLYDGGLSDAGRDGDASPCVPSAPADIVFDTGPTDRLAFDPEGPAEPAPATTSLRRVALAGTPPELLVTEALDRDTVSWVRGPCDPECDRVALPGPYDDPARTATTDWDADGDLDVLVADLGILYPNAALVGRVLLVERTGPETFAAPRVLLDQVGRVACAEPGDLDGDGDSDVVVCVFGDTEGSVRWLEQEDGVVVANHVVDPRPGAIHAFPFDADGDGDLDVVAAISQTFEEVVLYRNAGDGVFSLEPLFTAGNSYWGTSGIELDDFDGDGDVDVLTTNGDVLDGDLPRGLDPRDLHELAWLENDGEGRFTRRVIANLWGAYGVRATDLDGDCRRDLVVTAYRPDVLGLPLPFDSLFVFVDAGGGRFVELPLGESPRQVLAVELVDLDGNGVDDVWAGSLESSTEDGTRRLVTYGVSRVSR